MPTCKIKNRIWKFAQKLVHTNRVGKAQACLNSSSRVRYANLRGVRRSPEAQKCLVRVLKLVRRLAALRHEFQEKKGKVDLGDCQKFVMLSELVGMYVQLQPLVFSVRTTPFLDTYIVRKFTVRQLGTFNLQYKIKMNWLEFFKINEMNLRQEAFLRDFII